MSKHPDDGGPAFPLDVNHGDGGGHCNAGMSLRDWFAGQIISRLIGGDHRLGNWRAFAEDAYAAADAMLKARNQPKGD